MKLRFILVLIFLSLFSLTSCKQNLNLENSERTLLKNEYRIEYLTQGQKKDYQKYFYDEAMFYYEALPSWSDFKIIDGLYFIKTNSTFTHDGFIFELESDSQASNLFRFLSLSGFIRNEFSSVLVENKHVIISNNMSQTEYILGLD